LVDDKFDISSADWLAYYKKMALFYQAQYAATSPRIRLLFNPTNDPDESFALIKWLHDNCPHALIKAGNTGHMYQINGERAQVQVLRSQLFAQAGDDFLRARSEFGEESDTGGWLEAPAWNMYSLLQAALYTGLDINCFERGDAVLSDRQFFPAFKFFNQYAGLKDPATIPGAWCALRDGLDAADTTRFPAEKFGEAKLGNRDRFLKIAETFAANGAKQGDPEGGMRNGIRNRSLNALNDVGWDIYRGNYEMFLEQIDANATSTGHWRVGPKDQPYGRYARGFEHAAGKDTLFFRLDPRFLTAGADKRAAVHIVYFDEGTGRWALRYQDATGALKQAVEVQKKNTRRWQEITVPLDDAGFGGKGPRGCDLQLQNTDAEDDLFQLVEVLRRS
ncbi:MAG: type sorting protein, partial [Lacunisphaera sp.]|nr:type sorting protein [Lacunisphaera sp.]